MPTVRGPWITDYVKMIRAFLSESKEETRKAKQEEFNSLLRKSEQLVPEDWEIIWGKIFPSARYNYDSFQRIGNAVFKIIAKEQLVLVRAFGRNFISGLLELAPNLLVKGDPLFSLEKLCNWHEHYFKEVDSRAIIKEKGKNSAVLELKLTSADNRFPDASKAFAHQLGGSLEQLVAIATEGTLEELNPKKRIGQTTKPDVTLEIKGEVGKYTYSLTWK